MWSLAAHTQQAPSGSLRASYVHMCRRAGLPPEPPEDPGRLPMTPRVRKPIVPAFVPFPAGSEWSCDPIRVRSGP